MGEVIHAYRNHPYHPRPIPQEAVGRWAGISQTQLSRVESGPAVQDLRRLTHWALTLKIPARLLWFELAESGSGCAEEDGDMPSSGTSEVSKTLRRDFAALSGTPLAGSAWHAFENELDLIHGIRSSTASSERIAYLEELADDHGRTGRQGSAHGSAQADAGDAE
jgi:hypothetical protein